MTARRGARPRRECCAARKLDKQAAILRERTQNVLLFNSDHTAIFARIAYELGQMEIKYLLRYENHEGSTAMRDGQLDETDRQILRTLSRDGRISNQKLAETVHLSPTPCWHRVKAL